MDDTFYIQYRVSDGTATGVVVPDSNKDLIQSTEGVKWTTVPYPNPEAGFVNAFDEDKQAWVSKPVKAEPSVADKANAAMLQTLASQKMVQDKFNSQMLLQLATLTTKPNTDKEAQA